MLKVIGFIIKMFVLSLLILIADNWISWNGRTLNHHLQSTIRGAEQSDMLSQARDWTRQLTSDAREGIDKRMKHRSHSSAEKRAVAGKINRDDKIASQAQRAEDVESSDVTRTAAAAPSPALVNARAHAELPNASGEKIPSSERQKLRALIRELNSSPDKH